MVADVSVLKAYLGEFFVRPLSSKLVLDQIQVDTAPGAPLTFGYQVKGLSLYRQVVQAVILSYRRNISWLVADAYKDIVEKYLGSFNGNADPSDSAYMSRLTSPELLIIVLLSARPKNQGTVRLCLSVAESRALMNRRTLFMMFAGEPELVGMPIVCLDGIISGAVHPKRHVPPRRTIL